MSNIYNFAIVPNTDDSTKRAGNTKMIMIYFIHIHVNINKW